MEIPSCASAVRNASNNNARPPAQKKNQYPCPLAKQANCSESFTTSGHASRHAKKHAAKKDAFFRVQQSLYTPATLEAGVEQQLANQQPPPPGADACHPGSDATIASIASQREQ
ncbi:hypothetical protein WHR41_09529 [Cladosporium halotolerans]|uniref:C2H2-type domain-containing protein n=1 Tax=Cladosporium halotolerans TaxID=1052096 RepID=A0AB34K9Q1_9PEZI